MGNTNIYFNNIHAVILHVWVWDGEDLRRPCPYLCEVERDPRLISFNPL